MNSVPCGWITCSLDSLLTSLESGSRPKGGVRGIKDGVPSIGGEHLTYKGTFDFSSIKYVPEEFAGRMSKGRLQKNDILIVKDGATTGKTAVVDEKFPFDNALVNEHVFVCRPSPLIETRFLFRYLTSQEGKERILENFQGSAQGGINLSFAPNTAVPLSPFQEQLRIVAKLEQLLAKVEACQERLNKIPVILKRFRQSVLAAACSGRLTADWRDGNHDVETATNLLLRIKELRISQAESKKERTQAEYAFQELYQQKSNGEIEYVDIPESWTCCTIGVIGTVCNGSTPSRKRVEFWAGKIPWVSSGEVHNNIIKETREKITESGYESTSVRRLPRGTVLLAMIGEGKTRGQAAILDIEATINQNIAAIILDHGLLQPEYLWYWFQHQYYRTRDIGSGSGPQALNCQRVRELPFVLPPLLEQQEVVRRVEALFKIAERIEERYQKAKRHVDKLTQSILSKAFRGELVPQDPNDEPASALLERVLALKNTDAPVTKARNIRSRKRNA